MSFDLSEYVDVKSRLKSALIKYPTLTITELPPRIIDLPDGKTFIEAGVIVGRDPDDPKPVQAHCWEPYPGRTPFTKDSEQANAATSALGRALGYMGFGIDLSLASFNEVRNRQADSHPSSEPNSSPADDYAPPGEVIPMRKPTGSAATGGKATDGQKKLINTMSHERGLDSPDFDGMTFDDASQVIDRLKKTPKVK
jgi:hypothetical protein